MELRILRRNRGRLDWEGFHHYEHVLQMAVPDKMSNGNATVWIDVPIVEEELDNLN